jgi:hypothetical protein
MQTTTTTTIDTTAINAAVRSILSDNTKLRKLPNGQRIINAGVALAPAKRSGVVNVCPYASAACILVCVLWFAGRTVTRTVREAATKRTKLWHYDPTTFYARLRRELAALARKAARDGVRAFCRLNVASDINHPHEIATSNPSITLYDYTKDVEKAAAYGRGELPANYHVSYSVSERSTFDTVKALHTLGVNLVCVFDSHYFGPLHRFGIVPATVIVRSKATGEEFTVETVDGDIHDLRVPEFDGRGKMVVLRAKSGAVLRKRAAEMGFIHHHAEGSRWFVDEYIRQGTAVIELA